MLLFGAFKFRCLQVSVPSSFGAFKFRCLQVSVPSTSSASGSTLPRLNISAKKRFLAFWQVSSSAFQTLKAAASVEHWKCFLFASLYDTISVPVL